MDAQAQQAVRILRFFKLSLVVGGALFIFLTSQLPAKAAVPAPAVELIIFVFAVASVGAGFLVPKFIGMPAEPSLLVPAVSAHVKQWFGRSILSLALFQICNLFGLVLHLIGAHARTVEFVFAVGMLSLIFWNPGTPPSKDEATQRN